MEPPYSKADFTICAHRAQYLLFFRVPRGWSPIRTEPHFGDYFRIGGNTTQPFEFWSRRDICVPDTGVLLKMDLPLSGKFRRRPALSPSTSLSGLASPGLFKGAQIIASRCHEH